MRGTTATDSPLRATGWAGRGKGNSCTVVVRACNADAVRRASVLARRHAHGGAGEARIARVAGAQATNARLAGTAALAASARAAWAEIVSGAAAAAVGEKHTAAGAAGCVSAGPEGREQPHGRTARAESMPGV